MKNSSRSDSVGIFATDKDDVSPEVASLFPAGDSMSSDCTDRNLLDGVVSLLQEDGKEERSTEAL